MPKPFWTTDKILFIKSHLKMTDAELAVHFSITAPSVKSARKKHGISKFIRKVFIEDENNFLRKMYPGTRTDKIAEQLNRSLRSIYMQATNLGLKKSKEFLASPESGILTKGTTRGKATQFEKGHVPANKGVKMSPELRDKVKHTWFERGHKPHNTRADGVITTRFNKKAGYSYKYIRIGEGLWVDLKRHIWEQANGPVPSGFNVVFKTGAHGNYDLSNIEIVTNAELLDRNTLHQWSPELKEVIKLNNKLKKQIDGRHKSTSST
jgi:hypothetical protein